MQTPPTREVTDLLLAWGGGDRGALEKLIPMVYGELRRLADRHLRRHRPDQTLQTTALVHEAYLRLVDQKSVSWQNRAHFYGAAANLMRQILVDHARRHHAAKRGGGAATLSFDEVATLPSRPDADLLAVDEALNKLASMDPRQSKIVELRFFGGLSIEDTAEVLGVSPATVKRDWRMAKAWLHQEMSQS